MPGRRGTAMKDSKDFLQRFRVGIWAVVGLVLVVIAAFLIA